MPNNTHAQSALTQNSLEADELFFFGQLLADCSAMELLKQILAYSHHAIVITEADRSKGYPIVYGNAVFCRNTGYELAELIGRRPAMLQGPSSNYDVIKQISPTLEKEGYFYGSSVNYRKDGSMYPVEWNISAIRNAQGKVTHYLSLQKDLSHLQHLAKQIDHSNKVVKEYVKDNLRDNTESPKMLEVVETLKKNDKLSKNSLFTRDSGVDFDNFFEDFSSEEANVVNMREKKVPISAHEFWSETPFESEDITSIVESIEEVETEISILDSQGLTKQRMKNIADGFNQIANNLFFCVELNEGALVIDEVAKTLGDHANSNTFPVSVLSLFNKDVSHWIDGIFIKKNAHNIFAGETNVIATGNQLLTFLRQTPSS